MMKKLGIYVHVPFCIRKCNYCDFYSVKWDETLEDEYVDTVIEEAARCDKETDHCQVDTVFIGGGTPSVLSCRSLEKLLAGLKTSFTITEDAEITIEANPNSLSAEGLAIFRKLGINRLSIGIQSMDDAVLKRIGRLHTSKEAAAAVKAAQNAGFNNVNADIMFNIPGQTAEKVSDTLLKVIDMGVKHISFYSLKLEEGTPMYSEEQKHSFTMPDEDEERRMYYAGRQVMEKHGFMQYEISNFALRGYECRHNLKYWQQQQYIGLGPAAHSFIGNLRYSNRPNLREYLQDSVSCRVVQEVMNENDLMFEYVMLHLRLNSGVDKLKFKQRFGQDFDMIYHQKVRELETAGLVKDENDKICLTYRGIDLSNYVFEELM